MRKPFEKDVYDECDEKARDAARKHLDSLGIHTLSRENYDADIIAFHEKFHEVEVKLGWEGEWNRVWKDIHIPYRKKRLLEKHRSGWFWIFRRDCKMAWIIPSEQLRLEYVTEVPNKKIKKDELFYCVPVEKAYLIELGKDKE